MKHDSLRKLDRNAILVALRDQYPDLSWDDIGIYFGISRQRAQAIYKKAKENNGQEENG